MSALVVEYSSIPLTESECTTLLYSAFSKNSKRPSFLPNVKKDPVGGIKRGVEATPVGGLNVGLWRPCVGVRIGFFWLLVDISCGYKNKAFNSINNHINNHTISPARRIMGGFG